MIQKAECTDVVRSMRIAHGIYIQEMLRVTHSDEAERRQAEIADNWMREIILQFYTRATAALCHAKLSRNRSCSVWGWSLRETYHEIV